MSEAQEQSESMKQPSLNRVAIVGGMRTPFVKSETVFKHLSALELSVKAIDGLLSAFDLDPADVELLNHGIVVLDPGIPQMAREVVFGSKLPSSTRAVTFSDNCITGASALVALAHEIMLGRVEIGVAGGVESMSNAAITFRPKARRLFHDLNAARSTRDRLGLALQFRPTDFLPHAPSVAEPSTGMSMGEHCELMVKEWKVGRKEQDEIAFNSHQNAHQATEDGRLTAEIVTVEGVDRDKIIRPSTTMEKLAKLKPVFDKSSTGTLTAGNSSPLTDGAAAVLAMSEERAQKEGREILAFLKDYEFASIDPKDGLLMGPGVAVPRMLKRNGLTLEDIDIIEMHEAFGGQVHCNIKSWEQGWKEAPIGSVDLQKLNPLGSSIAVGHPFAATGIRIVTTLANELKRRGAKRGLISICAAGAQAAAILLERD